MKIKEFMSKWIEGMRNLTPEMVLKGQLLSQGFIILGFIFSFFFIVETSLWYFFLAILGITLMQVWTWVDIWKRLDGIRKLQKEMQDMEGKQ